MELKAKKKDYIMIRLDLIVNISNLLKINNLKNLSSKTSRLIYLKNGKIKKNKTQLKLIGSLRNYYKLIYKKAIHSLINLAKLLYLNFMLKNF